MESLPPGTHLITPRSGYLHHGLYTGDGKVIHYRGFKQLWLRGPVEEVSVDEFARGRGFLVRALPATPFEGLAAVRRARSRLGESRYRLFTNNCRHFVTWCLALKEEAPHGY